jgi:DNA polymerase III sliding clamp (beta) subunit (PCNA family)
MTKITFQTATFADVVRRAASIAPTKGDALDKVAGVVLKLDAETNQVVVMATDTLVFYMEAVATVEFEGESGIWRLPSSILASITGKLPIGSGSTVMMEDESEPPQIVLRSGRTKVKLSLLDHNYYPLWTGFDPDGLTPVNNFGSIIKQVAWAQSTSEMFLSGVALFPDAVGATDRYRLARVAVNTGLDERVMIPGKILAQVIPENGTVSIGRTGNSFLCSPNQFTQIRTVVLDTSYPDLARILNTEYDCVSHFSRSEFQPMIARALDFTGGDRQARMSMFIGRGEVALYMDNQEVGLFGDITDASGAAATHARIKIEFNPINLRDAIATFPGEVVTMKYNMDRNRKSGQSIAFTDEGAYFSSVQPLQAPPEAED